MKQQLLFAIDQQSHVRVLQLVCWMRGHQRFPLFLFKCSAWPFTASTVAFCFWKVSINCLVLNYTDQREETGSTAASQTLADRAGHAASVAYTRACQIFPQPPQAPQLNGDPISSSACFPSVQAESNLNAGNTLSSVAHSMAPVQGGDTRQDFGGYQSTRPAWENQVPSWLNKGQSAAQDTIPSASAAGKIPEAGPSNRGAFSGQISTPPVRIPTTPCVIGSQCTPQSTGQRRLKRLYSQVYTPTDTHISEEALEDDVEDKMVEEFTDLMSPPPNRKAKVFSLQQGVIDLCDSPSPLGQPGHQGPREETKIQTAPEQSNFQQTRREENGLEQRTRLQDIKLNLEDDAFMIDLSAEWKDVVEVVSSL